MSLAEWAEAHIMLSPEDSAFRGKFAPWPFQREPMEVMSPAHPCERVALKCASQTMKTRLLLNMLAFVVAVDPGPCLFVEPTEADAQSLSKDRVDPMLRDTPALRGLVTEAKSRDAGNTIAHKKFRGGQVSFAFSTAPSKLAMRPIRYLFLDEVSRYGKSSGKEGDPVRIAEKRTVTFWNKKIIYASSPGTDGDCRISEIFENSDQRHWFVPCPFCGHEQALKFSGLVWSKGDEPIECQVKSVDGDFVATEVIVPVSDPRYQCECCRCLISHNRKQDLNAAGRWKPTNPLGKFPGFHLNQLVSPVRTWADIVDEWLEIQGKREQLQVFMNTVLAETWRDSGEAPDWEKVKSRASDYDLGTVPPAVRLLTAGVDVQRDRLECAVWGWDRTRGRWLVDYQKLYGDSARDDVWNKLSELLNRSYRRTNGGAPLQILRMGVDTGSGSKDVTDAVYAWGRKQGTARVMLIKGFSDGPAIVFGSSTPEVTDRGRKRKRQAPVYHVNVSRCKAEIYSTLRSDKPEDGVLPSGWVHYPEMPDEWFKQLTAEEYHRTKRGGEWQQIRERNEALDTANYARACVSYGSLHIDLWTEGDWSRFDTVLQAEEAAYRKPTAEGSPADAPVLSPANGSRRTVSRVARSSFLSS
jgi:phage terminase large subunit GpA-like protein